MKSKILAVRWFSGLLIPNGMVLGAVLIEMPHNPNQVKGYIGFTKELTEEINAQQIAKIGGKLMELEVKGIFPAQTEGKEIIY